MPPAAKLVMCWNEAAQAYQEHYVWRGDQWQRDGKLMCHACYENYMNRGGDNHYYINLSGDLVTDDVTDMKFYGRLINRRYATPEQRKVNEGAEAEYNKSHDNKVTQLSDDQLLQLARNLGFNLPTE